MVVGVADAAGVVAVPLVVPPAMVVEVGATGVPIVAVAVVEL